MVPLQSGDVAVHQVIQRGFPKQAGNRISFRQGNMLPFAVSSRCQSAASTQKPRGCWHSYRRSRAQGSSGIYRRDNPACFPCRRARLSTVRRLACRASVRIPPQPVSVMEIMSGLIFSRLAWSRPRRSMTPGLELSETTSLILINRVKTSIAPGCFRLIVKLSFIPVQYMEYGPAYPAKLIALHFYCPGLSLARMNAPHVFPWIWHLLFVSHVPLSSLTSLGFVRVGDAPRVCPRDIRRAPSAFAAGDTLPSAGLRPYSK